VHPVNRHTEVRLQSILLGGHRRAGSEEKATAKSNRRIVESSSFRLGWNFGEAQVKGHTGELLCYVPGDLGAVVSLRRVLGLYQVTAYARKPIIYACRSPDSTITIPNRKRTWRKIKNPRVSLVFCDAQVYAAACVSPCRWPQKS
jgi:hypothetical protein